MYKQKIGISVGNNYSIPTIDVIKLLKEIGFDAISPEWKKDAKIDELVKNSTRIWADCSIPACTF